MKKTTAVIRSLSIHLALFGTLAAASAAHAVTVNHSGTICKNYNRGDVSYIDYFANGTRSLKTTSTAVICPLVRPINSSNGAIVYVDIKHSASATTSCTAYSYNAYGTLLASYGQTWTGSGWHEFPLNLSGSGKTVSWGDISVVCTIPGNGYGVLMGIDTVEN